MFTSGLSLCSAFPLIIYSLRCFQAEQTNLPSYTGFIFIHILTSIYTRRQINLYPMFFANFLVNSQPILMQFCKEYFRVMRRLD